MLILVIVMKKSENCFREIIKRAFSAFAYEHSGEMLSLYRKRQVLSGSAIDKAAKKKYPGVVNKTTGSKRISHTFDRGNEN